MLRIAIVTATFTALLGCASLDSEELLTTGISAEITVTADGSGSSDVTAVLRAGGGLSTTFVDLSSGDELTATLGEETQVLTEVSLAAITSYTTTFDTAPTGEDYIISLDRIEFDSAPNTVVQLPPPFELEPLAVEDYSRSEDPLTVSWSPSDTTDDMRVTVDGDCFLVHFQELSGDPGTYTIEAGTLEDTGSEPSNCEATVTVQRRRAGQLDPGYGEGGSAAGLQVREVSIGSAP